MYTTACDTLTRDTPKNVNMALKTVSFPGQQDKSQKQCILQEYEASTSTSTNSEYVAALSISLSLHITSAFFYSIYKKYWHQ